MKLSGVRWLISPTQFLNRFLKLNFEDESRGKTKVDNGNSKNFSGSGNGKTFDKLIKLGQAEKMMRKVMSPVPSRPTLIAYIRSGILKGKQFSFNNHFYIFESSLKEFIEKYGQD